MPHKVTLGFQVREDQYQSLNTLRHLTGTPTALRVAEALDKVLRLTMRPDPNPEKIEQLALCVVDYEHENKSATDKRITLQLHVQPYVDRQVATLSRLARVSRAAIMRYAIHQTLLELKDHGTMPLAFGIGNEHEQPTD